MADSIVSQLGLSNIGLPSMSTFAAVGIVIAIAVLIIAAIGVLIYIFSIRKSYWIKIHVFRLIGNSPQRVGIYSAKEVAMGMAGDKLWRVAPAGIIKFKLIKWLPVGKIQTAPKEFWYWIRYDGEWINFSQTDLDEVSRKMNVKFVQEDMRLQRLATDRLLEQRLMKKTFWEKWGNIIMTLVVFLVIAVAIAIIFYQFSKLVDKIAPVLAGITEAVNQMRDSNLMLQKACALANETRGGLLPT